MTEPLYEAIVRTHRAVSRGGCVYLAGEIVRLPFEELKALEGAKIVTAQDDAYDDRFFAEADAKRRAPRREVPRGT